jgi:DNA modification methylase
MNKTDLATFYENIDSKYILTNNALQNASYQSDSNFTLSVKYPRHRWFYYKEGFSPVLVEDLLREFRATQDSVVCDPFCGAGTTLAVAQANGMQSIGFEVNPFAALISSVKTAKYTEEEISEFTMYLDTLLESALDISYPAPDNEYLRRIFSPKMLTIQQNIKAYIRDLPEGNAKDLMYFCWLCTLEDCSLFRKAGNGLKVKTRKPDFSILGEKLYAVTAIQERAKIIMQDIKNPVEGPIPTIYCESATTMESTIGANSLDVVIFSPPYANCFDYTKIYYLELWFGGFVNSKNDQNDIRMKSIRSHVHSTWPERYENFRLPELHDVIIPLIEKEKMWTNRIPSMLNGYFADMSETLRQIFMCMKPGGHCAIVVSNSAYAGVIVPTDVLLARIAENLGFKIIEIKVERLIITSSQQYKKTEHIKKYLRESIVKLQKPEV